MTQQKTELLGSLSLAVLSLMLLCGAMLVYPANAGSFELYEYRITTNTADQEFPAISDYNIVYQDNRNGNWDIYLSNVAAATPTESRLTTDPANQMTPAISGSIIVYKDDRNGNLDIYMYNLTSQTETQITTNTASQTNPDIDGNNIVWMDNRNGNWDIYTYDLSTHTEKRVTTSSANEQNPAVSNNLVVFDRGQAVFCYDLANDSETQVSNTGDSNYNPAIYDTYVVYESSRASEQGTLHFLVMRDIAGTDSWETYNATQSDINGNYIVYEDHSTWTFSGNNIIYGSNIYLFNIDSRVITQITSNINDARANSPKVSGGNIVYMDNRNGNLDIYMTTVVVAQAAPTSTRMPRLGAAGPGGTQSESETFSLTSSAIAAIAITVVFIILISLAVYYKKHKSAMLREKHIDNVKAVSTKSALLKGGS